MTLSAASPACACLYGIAADDERSTCLDLKNADGRQFNLTRCGPENENIGRLIWFGADACGRLH